MRPPPIKQQQLDIVLLGEFNPQIFQPQWFTFQKLLGETEGNSAKVEIIHSDVAIFHLDWLRFEVTRNRLVATTSFDQYYEVLRDLIIGAFTNLSHTPLKAVGINNSFSYIFSEEKVWHAIGHKLAPKDIWNKVLDNPGLRVLTIQGSSNIKDTYKNLISISIKPPTVNLELNLFINNHYEIIPEKTSYSGSSEIIKIIKEEWNNAQEKAINIRDSFFEELP
jgi:hypothetical protein